MNGFQSSIIFKLARKKLPAGTVQGIFSRSTRLTEYLFLKAKEREARLASDHPLVAQFWETFHYINSETNKKEGWLNHSADEGLIAVNLNEFRMACQDYGQELMDFKLLKRRLPESRSHRYIDKGRSVWRPDDKKAMRCWVFKR